MQNIIEVIQKYSLTVRCLPYEVVTYWTYCEGDENKVCVDSKGEPIKIKRELAIRSDGKKFLKESRTVEKGGWWYVKATPHTNSTVIFNKKYDKFFAPTLEEAIALFLKANCYLAT